MTALLHVIRSPRGRWLATATIAATILVAWRLWPAGSSSVDPAANPVSFPEPPYSASHYSNTRSAAGSIGTAACVECHAANHQSYLLTAHSRAFAEVDPSREPADASFVHKASGRTYRVYRKDGQLHHREVLTDADGRILGQTDLPVRYRIGSGHHARSYVVEVDGFFHESPLNWYTSKNMWDMSPGYDVANHGGFERPILLECLACHTGRTEEVAGALNRFTVHEQAIGCENCHGPGSLHQELRRRRPLARGEEDLTIVHPGRLPRPLQEAICSSCHLGDPAIVAIRGREIGDFEPGRPLNDFRIHYRLEGGRDSMSVAGHVDQMHQSACYLKSDMTCLTCHDPHLRQAPADRVSFFRERCLSCHDTRPCTLDRTARLAREPRDNCAACHMPQSAVDAPHVAFTQHRIAVHTRSRAAEPAYVPDLVATEDNPQLSELDRERNLGLAYLVVRNKPEYAAHANEFRTRAHQHLEAAYRGGLRDADTVMGLAELEWRGDRGRARDLAREALAIPNIPARVRVLALFTSAYSDYQNGRDADAEAALEELGRLRRFADDWRLLGSIQFRRGEPARARASFQKALEIRPFRAASHEGLADAYDRLEDRERASEQRALAASLRLLKQD